MTRRNNRETPAADPLAGLEATLHAQHAQHAGEAARPGTRPAPGKTPPAGGVTPATVAKWMLARLERDGRLEQRAAVREIGARFGGEFTAVTAGGHMTIDGRVRRVFRHLTRGTAVWDCSEYCWRWRRPGDAPGRYQN